MDGCGPKIEHRAFVPAP
uniref:Uncharacterized protein n=1 Tax=Anguilla anguilla TaxID=7936 RepID=A0A0E9QAB5_ANGAN